ncbi:isopropylmalate/homocitrate/citramalate synthase [Rhizobium sp. ZPR3]|uniref:Isopropylmalate/homocitrate/citramalate synthase n=2 Tax=unclassified Rhizobium TaxID=2613769 RepID=A0AAU7S9Z0_9HYPH
MDRVEQAARSGAIIFHEEIARDGAQGKTLLLGHQRVSIARKHMQIFGEGDIERLVFNAGFPSIGQEEFETVREVVDNVDFCYIGASGRATIQEAQLLIRSMRGAAFGRLSIAVPVSEAMCSAMMHKSPDVCLSQLQDVVKFILDSETTSCIDVAFMDATRADIGFVAEAASALTEAGVSMIIICDTVGGLFPVETRSFFGALLQRTKDKVSFVAHMHNDLGFGLVNTLEAVSCGVRAVTGSWLGLGERSGMPATEQLLFALGHQTEMLSSRLNVPSNIWSQPPNLKEIAPTARFVSQVVGRPLLTTDPIVGPGVNSISTGTPFVDTLLFQPYDPEATLGVSPKIHVTQLASKRVIEAALRVRGLSLDVEQVERLLSLVKKTAYERGVGILEEDDFLHLLRQISY